MYVFEIQTYIEETKYFWIIHHLLYNIGIIFLAFILYITTVYGGFSLALREHCY